MKRGREFAVWTGAGLVCAAAACGGDAADPGDEPREDYSQQIHDLIAAAQPEAECNAWDGIAAFTAWWEAREAENEAAVARGEDRIWEFMPCNELWGCEGLTAAKAARLQAGADRTWARLDSDGVLDVTTRELRCGRCVPPVSTFEIGTVDLATLSSSRKWAFLAVVQAEKAFEAGEHDRGASLAGSVLDSAVALSYGLQVHTLAALGITGLGVDAFRSWLMRGMLSPEALDAAAAELARSANCPRWS